MAQLVQPGSPSPESLIVRWPLYLASSSPRRRLLLTQAGIPFMLYVVPVDEDALSAAYTGPLDLLGEYLAQRKAQAAVDVLHAD